MNNRKKEGNFMTQNRILSVLAVLFACFCSASFAGETPQYVGAKKCAACHKEQFTIWSQGPHAGAYAILGSGTEKVTSNMKSLHVSGDPQLSAACLKCHVAGYGEADDAYAKSYDFTEGVTCEACHGPGSLYRQAMLTDEERYAADPKNTVAAWEKMGLVKPAAMLCKSCHSYDEQFDFAEKFKKIAHPRARK